MQTKRLAVIFSIMITIIFATNGYTQPKPSTPGILKVGCMGPLSGAAAAWGLSLPRTTEMRVEEINATGGLKVGSETYTIQLVYYDHMARADEAATVAKKLIFDDKVKYILGNGIAACCNSSQLITEPNKVLMTFICWGIQNLGPGKPYSFRTYHGPLEVVFPFYEWVFKKHGEYKTLAMLNPNDTTGLDTAKASTEACDKLGIKVVADIKYERGTKEFGPFVTKLIMAKPDVLDFGGSPAGDAGMVARGLYERGYTCRKIFSAGGGLKPYFGIAGEGAEGTYTCLAWDFEGPRVRPAMREMARKYRVKYGEPVDLAGVSNYIGAQVVFEAMKIAGSIDVDKVIETLVSKKFETVLGPLVIGGKEVYGIDRQFYYPMVTSVYQGGKLVDLEEIAAYSGRR